MYCTLKKRNSCKKHTSDKKKQKVVGVYTSIYHCKLQYKLHNFTKITISTSLCVHIALDALSDTYLTDDVSEITIFTQNTSPNNIHQIIVLCYFLKYSLGV